MFNTFAYVQCLWAMPMGMAKHGKTVCNSEKFNLMTDGQTDTITSAGVELRLRS